jgi:hypothetical protein
LSNQNNFKIFECRSFGFNSLILKVL